MESRKKARKSERRKMKISWVMMWHLQGSRCWLGRSKRCLRTVFRGSGRSKGPGRSEGKRCKEWNPTGGQVGDQRHMGTHMGQGDRQRRLIGD